MDKSWYFEIIVLVLFVVGAVIFEIFFRRGKRWECECGVSNSLSTQICAGCGWTQDQTERHKAGLIPNMSVEDQQKRDKSALRQELRFFKKIILMAILAIIVSIFLTYVLEYDMEGFFIFAFFLLLSIGVVITCGILMLKTWLRYKKL